MLKITVSDYIAGRNYRQREALILIVKYPRSYSHLQALQDTCADIEKNLTPPHGIFYARNPARHPLLCPASGSCCEQITNSGCQVPE
ncbi:MAG: hypothetical protein DSY90_00875 [Deltaproteobacteria bacterium]|nr:MAG: hypothetical protein DSY90_00875 [Deltaproteobacteria bacterium]